MDSGDSWEEVVNFEDTKTKRRTRGASKVLLLHKILWIFKKLGEQKAEDKVESAEKQKNNFNKYKVLEAHVFQNIRNSIDRSVALFKYCIKYEIPVRIGFVLGKEITAFLETCLANTIETHKQRYDSEVFGVDYHSNISDLTFLYSKKHNELHLNTALQRSFKTRLFRDQSNSKTESIFTKDDRSRITRIPNSLLKIKGHPVYTMERLLGTKKTVFPKRPIYGYFKGEAVYDKRNIQKLYTEKQLYYRGKRTTSKSPYRIVSGTKLYAPWQAEDIVIGSLAGKSYMDYFHPNFLPLDCFYSSSLISRHISQLLGMRHSNCITRFVNRLPASEGTFIEKKNAYVHLNFLREYEFYEKLLCSNQQGLKRIAVWEKFIKRIEKYLYIRKRIG